MSDVNKTYVFETVLISGTTTTAEYITGATFNTTTGTLNLSTVSGNTITTDFDGRYSLTGHTHTTSEIIDFPTSLSAFTNDGGFISEDTNNFVTGATFNSGTGEFILTTFLGDTVSETLDGRYLLSDDYVPNESNTDDYTTTAELSGDTLNFTRLSGGTYSVVLTGLTGTVAGPITFSAETLSDTTTYVGYGNINACKIRRIITSGATYSAFWSNSEETLDKIWANRYTYSYF
jgi:hypothetical protein